MSILGKTIAALRKAPQEYLESGTNFFVVPQGGEPNIQQTVCCMFWENHELRTPNKSKKPKILGFGRTYKFGIGI